MLSNMARGKQQAELDHMSGEAASYKRHEELFQL